MQSIRPSGISEGGVTKAVAESSSAFGAPLESSFPFGATAEIVRGVPLRDVSAEKTSSHDARRLFNRLTLAIALSDALSVLLALTLVDLILPDMQLVAGISSGLIFAAVPLGWVLAFLVFGLYAPKHLSAVEEFRRIIGASSFGMVALVMAGFWSATYLPRTAVGLLWGFVLLFELMTRRIWRLEIARRRANGSLALKTLVIGTNDEARQISNQLSLEGSGYRPVGFVAASSTNVNPSNLDVVSGIHRLGDQIKAIGAECVFIASTALHPDEMLKVMQVARQLNVDVRISAQLPEILSSRVAIQNVGDALTLAVKPVQLSGAQNLLKRAFDLVLSGVGLLLSLPLWIAIAATIKATSRGPVFFTQERVTKNGRRFKMIKFRTMFDDINLDDLGIDPSSPFFKLENDPRITPIGRLLRKTSLDELPQLLNVISGDMSLVGPRPLPSDQVNANIDLLSGRLEVPAGMTGWWQIRGRSDVAPEAAVKLDVFYIENWSLTLDLYILLKTVGVVLTRAGAF